jgi:hypothetical protein
MFVMARYTEADFAEAMRLSGEGVSDYEVARQLGMSRGTVFNWRRRKPRLVGLRQVEEHWRPTDSSSFAYLLGVYLGDGHLVRPGSGNLRLGVTLDERYPSVIEEVAKAMVSIGRASVCRVQHPGAIGLYASSPAWALAFPQHGPGRKHLRKIELADWQREITHGHPKSLLRGLIHSDGCRCLNRFKTKLPSGRVAEYAYPRYFFSNLSADIRTIFCDHCDLLGIHWTQSNPRNISVSHRRSVAVLDEFVGPKT